MQYSDNPRKVYGKVKIIYSDSEISKELLVETSGNGIISEPEQVYKGHISPTIKACTMDGNSTMGGGFQMNGIGFVCGWWSDVHCDSNGEFIQPPYLSVSFISRPIIQWTVIGDIKLNQYPVDFDILAYKNGTIIDTKEIRNNDKATYTLRYDEPLTDITKIKVVILKWNKPNAKAKLLQFFDILEEEYGGDDLKEFEVLEELSSEGESYSINSDTSSFLIYNRDRKFDKGYLRSLLLLGRKVIPYIGIEKENGIEYTALGIFYSDEWNVPQSDQWVKLKCFDKLLSLQKYTYIGYPYTINTSLYDIAKDIVKKAGFKEGQYEIDTALQNDIIIDAFMRKMTCWEALQELCYGGLCNAYIDINDVLRITKEKVNDTDIAIGADSILSYDKKTRKTDFSNYIEVPYCDIQHQSTFVTVFENVITIDAKSKVTMTVDYSMNISDAYISFMPSVGIEIIEFESGIDAGKFELYNNNSTPITTTVKIQGYAVTINTQTVVVQDSESIKQWGKMEYSYSGSSLIQSYDRAYEIGQILMAKLSQGSGNLKITWRGDPALRLQDKFTATDRFNDSQDFVTEYNRFKFNGGLKQDTRGRIDNK